MAPVTFLWPESSSSSEALQEPLEGGREDGRGVPFSRGEGWFCSNRPSTEGSEENRWMTDVYYEGVKMKECFLAAFGFSIYVKWLLGFNRRSS